MTTIIVSEVKEAPQEPARRTFPDVLNEWTDTLLDLNKTANIEQVALILHLGTLGQRLIHEANVVGQNEILQMAKERMRL